MPLVYLWGIRVEYTDLQPAAFFLSSRQSALTRSLIGRSREVLIDSARHFLPVAAIQQLLGSMAISKLNVLHWHLVDLQSFPFIAPSYAAASPTSILGAPSISTGI